MNNLKIKVCGITRTQDAKSAVKHGVDLLGFIFYKKSSRFISVLKAQEILKTISPTILRVGVFVNEDKNKVLNIAKKLQLDFIQLSGNENKTDISFCQKNGFKVIKTIHVFSKSDILKVKNCEADIIHLDRADKELYGGSGKQFDWDVKLPKSIKNLMLAGGINSENVLEGTKKFKPLIVDVNSGVEYKPGFKSDKLLHEFFEKVNRLRYGK